MTTYSTEWMDGRKDERDKEEREFTFLCKASFSN